MTEFLQAMVLPFLACLVLTGIHAYLGLHVIEREIIFVDLALAQIASVGAAVAILFGHDIGTPVSYWLSLGFTLAGAVVFSLTRFRKGRIPQEALIGVTYAVAASLLLLILNRSGEGDEHIRYTFVGNILLIRWPAILKMAVIYSAVGVFHFVYRQKFFLISRDPEEARRRGISIAWWDFLFYASFGLVVTSSVAVAGVLLVFAFLVVPASCAVLLANRMRTRLAVGWAIGVLASVIGMGVSYFGDLPTGSSVVCVFGLMLALLLAFRGRTQ